MSPAENSVPLCVDLDETLIHSDLTWEMVAISLRHSLVKTAGVLSELVRGRGAMKRRLAQIALPDVARLPYDQPLLDFLRQERLTGRRLILATGSDRTGAERVAAYLGYFDEVIGSDASVNLTREAKARVLVQRFGEAGFDYVGSESADIPVWKKARRCYGANVPAPFWACVQHEDKRLISGRTPGGFRELWASLRPHHWLKNLLLLVPAFTAHVWHAAEVLGRLALAFVVFSVTASVIYMINDFLDMEADRAHPEKNRRPLARGAIRFPLYFGVVGALLLFAGILLMALPLSFAVLVILYGVVSCAYSLSWKQVAYLDLILLVLLYELRIMAGGAAVAVPVSGWLLLFSAFFFFSLAAVKRVQEAGWAKNLGSEAPLKIRGYFLKSFHRVTRLGVFSAFLSIVVLGFYVASEEVSYLYQQPVWLWGMLPCMAVWLGRVWWKTGRGHMTSDPVLFALRDGASYVLGALVLAVIFLARPV